MKDYYATLGVTPDASQDDIKKAFRRLARETHPDANPGDTVAEARFREIAEAYEVLSDSQRRARYDRGDQFDAESLFSNFAGIEDLLSSFFGGGFGGFRTATATPVRGSDVEIRVQITLAEAATGVSRELEFATHGQCPACSGTGAEPGHPPEVCDQCRGAGSVQVTRRTILGAMTTVAPCDRCRGTGRLITNRCLECRGVGIVDSDRTLSVNIPAGIEHLTRLRIGGRGGEAPAGGVSGDLYVEVQVEPDERFERRGDDLIHTVRVGIAEAALGKRVMVPTVDGEERELEVPAGTQPGTVFRLARLGMPRLRRRGRGDLLVVIDVVVPSKLTKAQRTALEDYAETRGEEPAVKRRRRR